MSGRKRDNNVWGFCGKLLLALLAASLAATPAQATMYVPGVDPASIGNYPFDILPTAWDPGPNAARLAAGNPAPGSATWSIMGAGFADVSGFDPDHVGLTAAITALGVPGFAAGDYANLVNAAMNIWASASGFTNLGQVADGGVNAGAAQAAGGHLGDIRVAAWEIATAGVLAHAFQPGTEAIFGPGGTIAGDAHFDIARTWVDDAGDLPADPDFDLFTVVLHELGHSLGLGHSAVVGSVMEPFYGGGRRALHADDIAGIQAIYGPPQEAPEPTALLLLGLGLATLAAGRRLGKK
jgi:hypothetical protein